MTGLLQCAVTLCVNCMYRQTADTALVAAPPGNPLKADEVCSLRSAVNIAHVSRLLLVVLPSVL